MDIGTISIRYAKALLKYAIDGHVEDKVYEDMKMLASVYLHAPELRYMTENPLLSDEARMEVLCKACGDDVSQADPGRDGTGENRHRMSFSPHLVLRHPSAWNHRAETKAMGMSHCLCADAFLLILFDVRILLRPDEEEPHRKERSHGG